MNTNHDKNSLFSVIASERGIDSTTLREEFLQALRARLSSPDVITTPNCAPFLLPIYS